MRAKPYISFLRCFLRCFLSFFLHQCAWMLSLHASFMFSLKVLTFVFMRLASPSSRAYSPPGWYWEDSMLSGGVAPGYSQYSLPGWIVLLAVCGWFNQTLFKSIIVFGEAGRKLMQMYGGFWRSESRHLLLSLVFLHVSSKSILAWRAILWVSPGCSPGIAEGKDRLAWRAIRPRRWRREPQRQRRTTVAANGLKAQRAHSPGQVSAANDTPGHV